MNGLKTTEKNTEFDRHTYLAPSNVAIPDAVGMSIEMISLEIHIE